jgi:hypothetical protein
VVAIVVAAGIAESSLESLPLVFLSSIFSDADIFDKNEARWLLGTITISPLKMSVYTKPSGYKSYNDQNF